MATDNKNLLSSADIVSIIEVSGKSGVSELKFGGLHVKFDTPVERLKHTHGFFIPEMRVEQHPLNPPDTEISATQRQVAQEALEADELDLRYQQIADLMIEDPLRAEELLRDGQLEEADDADEEA